MLKLTCTMSSWSFSFENKQNHQNFILFTQRFVFIQKNYYNGQLITFKYFFQILNLWFILTFSKNFEYG